MIVGAGAIGGTVGARLVEAGHSVAFVARGDHGAAIAADGLTLASPAGRVTLRIPVFPSVTAAGVRAGDVVALAVKSQDAVAVLDELALSEPGGVPSSQIPVFCFQNGIDNEREASRRFAHVHGVCVRLPSTHLSPGLVIAHSAPLTGVLDIGRYAGGSDVIDEQVAAALAASGFSARVRTDVMAWKRRKLLSNLGNALEVVCPPDDPGRAEVLRAMVDEGLACFAAAGQPVVSREDWTSPPALEVRHGEVEGHPRQGGSTWQSVARGLPSVESDYLNGEIALLGRSVGVPTPVNVAVQDSMHRIVGGRLRPGATRPADLLA